MSFRNKQFLEGNEYSSFELDTPIKLPTNNNQQQTTGYKFSCNNVASPHVFDWYNAYLEMDFQLEKLADGSEFAAADRISTVNSAYNFINRCTVSINGQLVNECPQINMASNIKNLLEFSQGYQNIATNSFDYQDETNSTIVAYADFDAAYAGKLKESGFMLRHDKLIRRQSNNVILMLNRYGFFESLKDNIIPQSRVIISITLESSDNIIYRTGGDPGRIVVTKLKLHVPTLKFNAEGSKHYLTNYLKEHEWIYLNERLGISDSTTSSSGTFVINSVSKPRHVFIWALNNAKLMSQTHNIFHFNTFSIADQKHLVSAQLLVDSSNYIPQENLNPEEDTAKVFRMLMDYNKSYNDVLTGSQINRDTFKSLYGILYFDLRNLPASLRTGVIPISFKWALNGVPNAPFSWYALILTEESIKMVVQSGKVFLKK